MDTFNVSYIDKESVSVEKDSPKNGINAEYIALGEIELFAPLAELFKTKGYKIKSFCDYNKPEAPRGVFYDDVEIIPLKRFLSYSPETPVLIFGKIGKELEAKLQEHGLNNITVVPIHRMNLCDAYIEQGYGHKIEQALELMADEKSKDLIKSLSDMDFILTRKLSDNTFRDGKIQYFDEEIFKLSDNEVFVNGGSSLGETTFRFIAKTRSRFEKIYLFDPDPVICHMVTGLFRFINDERLEFFSTGLYDTDGVVNLKWGNIGNSNIDKNGEYIIQVNCLDTIIDRASFIKLNLNGAEKNALLGARRLIQKHRPKLAICAHHNIQDIWEIPMLINDICPDYKLYMRAYYLSEEHIRCIVCYAV